MKNNQIHTGLHARRLTNDGPSSLREKAFADQWQEEQQHDLLAYLLGDGSHKAGFSPRDAAVAATVIQWLGTSVGQSFLDKVDQSGALQMARSYDQA